MPQAKNTIHRPIKIATGRKKLSLLTTGKQRERGRRLHVESVSSFCIRRRRSMCETKPRLLHLYEHQVVGRQVLGRTIELVSLLHSHVYHARIPTIVRRDVDKPVPVLRRSSLGHRHALPVTIAVARARHSVARSAGETGVADAKSSFPVRNCTIWQHSHDAVVLSFRCP